MEKSGYSQVKPIERVYSRISRRSKGGRERGLEGIERKGNIQYTPTSPLLTRLLRGQGRWHNDGTAQEADIDSTATGDMMI